jgi:hypothetical protein
MIVAQVIEAVIAVRLTRGPGGASSAAAWPLGTAVPDAPADPRLRMVANLGAQEAACNRRRRAGAKRRHRRTAMSAAHDRRRGSAFYWHAGSY